MVESSVCLVMAESEIAALKETLLTQQQLLQKVYMDLEEERESSATAASEALSMILRLQGEKAAEKMEASQYKRFAEEKMYHAEESLVAFEDLIYQREMEIASLEFQVQAYRHKLLSLGFSDPCVGKMRLPDHQFLQRNEVQFGDNLGFHGTVKRINSLPAIPFKDVYSKKCISGREGSAIPLQELIPRKINEDLDCEPAVESQEIQVMSEDSAVGDSNSYWKQIKMLDERVKELSNIKDVDGVVESGVASSNHDLPSTMAVSSKLKDGSRDCLLNSAVSRDLSYDTERGATVIKLDPECTFSCSSSQAEIHDNLLEFNVSSIPCLETETVRSTILSTTIHDVFEVPQIHEDKKFCGLLKKGQKKLIFEGETRLGKLDQVQQETAEFHFEDEDGRAKKVLQCTHQQNNLSKSGKRDNAALVEPNIDPSSSQTEVQKLNKRLELLEGDRRIMKQEISERGENELQLLREINEQLNMIRSEIRSLKSKKSPPRDDSQLSSIMEAMLFYSL